MSIYCPSYNVSEESSTQGENWSLDARTASVILRCAWSDRHAIAAHMLGNQLPWPHASGNLPPLCQSIAIQPAGNAGLTTGQSIDYTHALLSVNYGHDAEDFFSESLEPTTEFVTLDPRGFRWGSGSGDILTEQEAPGRLQRGLLLNRTLYNIQGPLPASLLTLAGHVNDIAYTSNILGLTFAAETLLFGPPHIDRTVTTGGTAGYTISLPFTVNPHGWNSFWRAKSGTYEEIYNVGGSSPYKNYPLASFAAYLP